MTPYSNANRQKTLLSNHLDSFRHYSSSLHHQERGDSRSTRDGKAPDLTNHAPPDDASSTSVSRPKPRTGTFSVSDYFESHIATSGHNLRKDEHSTFSNPHQQGMHYNGGSGSGSGKSANIPAPARNLGKNDSITSSNTNSSDHIGNLPRRRFTPLSTTEEPSQQEYPSPLLNQVKPSTNRKRRFMSPNSTDSSTVATPLHRAAPPRIHATTRTIGQRATPPTKSNLNYHLDTAAADDDDEQLSPAQKRSRSHEKRVKLVEMRARQLQWMTSYEKEKKSFLEEIDALRETGDEIKKENHSLHHDIKQRDKSLKALKEQNQVYQKQTEELHLQIMSLKEQLNKKHADGLQPLADEYNRLTKQNRTELKHLQEKLFEAEQNHISLLEERDETIARQSKQIAEYESKIDVLTQRLESIHQQNMELRDQQDTSVSALQKELGQLKEEHTIVKEREAKLSKNVSALEAENTQQKEQLDTLKQQNQEYITSELQMRQRFTKDVKERDALIAKLQEENELARGQFTNQQQQFSNQQLEERENGVTLQQRLLKICTNLTTIESLIPGISAQRNDEIDDYNLSQLSQYVESQSGRVCRIIREKIEEETANQLTSDDCIIS